MDCLQELHILLFALHNGESVVMTQSVFKGPWTGFRELFAPFTREKSIGQKMNHFQISKPILRPDYCYLMDFTASPQNNT